MRIVEMEEGIKQLYHTKTLFFLSIKTEQRHSLWKECSQEGAISSVSDFCSNLLDVESSLK